MDAAAGTFKNTGTYLCSHIVTKSNLTIPCTSEQLLILNSQCKYNQTKLPNVF
jgi:hypothetical protein